MFTCNSIIFIISMNLVCTGSFLHAQAGLLDGKTVTTHWFIYERFENEFPKLSLFLCKKIESQNQKIRADEKLN